MLARQIGKEGAGQRGVRNGNSKNILLKEQFQIKVYSFCSEANLNIHFSRELLQ